MWFFVRFDGRRPRQKVGHDILDVLPSGAWEGQLFWTCCKSFFKFRSSWSSTVLRYCFWRGDSQQICIVLKQATVFCRTLHWSRIRHRIDEYTTVYFSSRHFTLISRHVSAPHLSCLIYGIWLSLLMLLLFTCCGTTSGKFLLPVAWPWLWNSLLHLFAHLNVTQSILYRINFSATNEFILRICLCYQRGYSHLGFHSLLIDS